MVNQCITVNMQQLATITIQSMVAQSITCAQCATPPCTTCNVVCPGGTCPSNISVVVTWANSGDFSGTFTPTITVDTVPTIGTSVTVPASGTNTSTFSVNGLSRGTHNICVDSGTIT